MRGPRFLDIVLLLAGVSNASFNCQFTLDGREYDLTKLKGVHTVQHSSSTPPTTTNSTWYINPCDALADKDYPEKESKCPSGTQICGVEHIISKDKDVVAGVIPVAGDLDGNQSGSTTSKLDKKDGVLVEFTGGKWGEQKDLGAKIEFICEKSKDKEGLEFEDWDGKTLKMSWKTNEVCKRDKGGDKGDDDKKKEPEKDKDGKKEPEKGKDDDKKTSTGGWGFFSWLFFLILIGVAVYVVWTIHNNYNVYGYRGVEVLPHSETLRDLPYLIRDFGRKVINTFNGTSGSRGGYSAV